MRVELNQFHEQVNHLRRVVEKTGLSAEDRYELFDDFDPFTDSIPPALLTSGHVATYALTAGMIEPFDIDALSKPATYLVAAEGDVRYRNEKGHVERFYLTNDMNKRQSESCVRDYVRLAPNSVCFLTLEPTFRMPSYLAARFNLLIRDVYRGLLVGTGPLVDPGFSGRLSIPIHNFTSQEYFIRAGEGLVYFEFTKLSWKNDIEHSKRIAWLPKPIDSQPPFPSSKNRRRSIDDYLVQATGGGPPQHAVQLAVAEMQSQAQNARNLLRLYTLGGIAAAVIFGFTGWSVYSSAQQFAATAQIELRQSREQLRSDISELKQRIDVIENPRK